MQNLFVLFLIVSFGFFSCTQDNKFDQKDIDEIKQVLAIQQTAWNDGDIDSFMSAYWNSEDLRFISSGRTSKGWQKTLEGYKSTYPDKKTMGKLEFEILDVFEITNGAAALSGSYYLTREIGDASGFFKLIFKKIGGEWLIISDMTCAN